jgi:hypothetical protein
MRSWPKPLYFGTSYVVAEAFAAPGGIVFEVRVVSAQSVIANPIAARVEIRDDDPGVVAAFAADDLAAGEGIDSPEPSLERQAVVDPARLQIREILDRQIRSDDSGADSGNRMSERIS